MYLLCATPIPRTLYMSLVGVRDMALIETYPEGRNPIETFVGETDYGVIRRLLKGSWQGEGRYIMCITG